MKRTPRTLAAVAFVAVTLAACGGGDDDAAEPVATPPPAESVEPCPAPTTPATSVPAGGPTATVPPDAPEALLPAIGPVDVIGTPLADLGEATIATDPARCAAAPVLVGLGFDGEPVTIDAATDGPTMVVFLAHWCPHCNAEVPRLTELRDAGRFPEWLNIVAVATGSSPDRPNFPPGDWLESRDWTWPAMADGIDMATGTWVAATAYGISGFPFIALVDGNGNVTARWSGESTPDELIARIDTYLGDGQA